MPATIEQLRIDRQLEEALATGADPLHLITVFGIDESTAIHYAANAPAPSVQPAKRADQLAARTAASQRATIPGLTRPAGLPPDQPAGPGDIA
jgi:hypothetical protein